jgi:hypothetical protein
MGVGSANTANSRGRIRSSGSETAIPQRVSCLAAAATGPTLIAEPTSVDGPILGRLGRPTPRCKAEGRLHDRHPG